MTLSEKRLGYGKILKKMDSGEYNFLGSELNYIAEGFVYPEEDVKKFIKEILKDIENKNMDLSNKDKKVTKRSIKIGGVISIIKNRAGKDLI